MPQYYEYHKGSYVTVGASANTASWTTDPTTLIGKSYYLGHDVEGGNVTANYVCFVISDMQYCMKASSDGSTYLTNRDSVLGPLRTADIITCDSFDDSGARCSSSGFGSLNTYPNGSVYVGAYIDVACDSESNGKSRCYE